MSFHPKSIISFSDLEGGQFGTLDVTAAKPHHIELEVGGDQVLLNKQQWIALARAVDRFFGLVDSVTEKDSVVTETDDEGHRLMVHEHTETTEGHHEGPRRHR